MNPIKPQACYTPQIISEQKHPLFIPIYQRLFAWDEESVKVLMIDLKNNYDTMLEQKTSGRPYYIGLITATQSYELVDGQQRFTVLMLLGLVLRKYFSGWDEFLLLDEKSRLRFIARDSDQAFMDEMVSSEDYVDSLLMDLSRTKKSDIHEHELMKEALRIINKTLKDRSLFSSEDYVKGYAEYVFNNTSFFIDTLTYSDSKDLNSYFETLNSTGKDLESHEVLKVELLSKMTDVSDNDKRLYTIAWNAISDMDRLLVRKRSYSPYYEKTADYIIRFNNALSRIISLSDAISENSNPSGLSISNLFSNYLPDINDFELNSKDESDSSSISQIEASDIEPANPLKENTSYRSLLTFGEFILLVLYIIVSTKKEIHENDIVKEDFFDVSNLKKTYEKYGSDISPECFITSMLKYRLLFDYFVIQQSTNEEKYRIVMREPDDIEQKTDLNESRLRLIQFESFQYVYSSKKTHYRWLCPLLRYVENDPSSIQFDDILNVLKQNDNSLHPKEKLLNKDDFRYDKSVDRYWFWRIDYYLWQERGNKFSESVPEYIGFNPNDWKMVRQCVDKYTFKRNRSIEHVAAQHPQNINGEAVESDYANLHEFGNLVMISSGMNSSLKNSTYEEKRGHIESCVKQKLLIESLAMLDIYTRNTDWTDSDISVRTSRMLNFLEETYSI